MITVKYAFSFIYLIYFDEIFLRVNKKNQADPIESLSLNQIKPLTFILFTIFFLFFLL